MLTCGRAIRGRPFDYAQGMLIGNKHDLKKHSQSAGEAEPAQAIPIPMHDNRDEAATRYQTANKKGYI